MVSDELKSITETLKTQGKMRFLSPCSEEQITQFVRKHNITLPKQYKEWLQFSDGGECFLPAGVQFYGISQKPFIDVDDNSRPDNSYVVIGVLASGDPILIKKDSEQISIYNQEAGRIEDDEVYVDFFAFLNDLYDILGMGE